MVVPTPDGTLNPLVLAAARIAGVDEIYRVGGAQAVAALAYGTRDHRAGRQDRRPRQRLCRGGQAARVRRRRHRHDRRPVGGRRARRFQRRSRATSPPTCSPRPSTTRPRSRSSSPTTSRWRATVGAEVERQLADLPRAKIAGASWRDYGAIILVAEPRRGRAAGRPARARASRNHRARRRGAEPSDQQRRRDLPRRRIRPRRSAIMSAAPITCCRPRARRASPRASASTISSSAPRSSNATRDRWRRSGRRRSRSARPRASAPTRARSRMRLRGNGAA